MANLFRMDLYRMFKSRGCKICLILTAVFAVAHTPLVKLLDMLAKLVARSGGEPVKPLLGPTISLSAIIGDPFPLFSTILIMLSVVYFYYADMEAGYIKNIAGQMPKRGFSILSRYLASIVHNAIFVGVCLVGKLIGTLPFQQIVGDDQIVTSIIGLLLKMMLLQSLCAVLLLAAASFRSKALGMVLAVMFGLGAMGLLYSAIDTGLNALIKGASIAPYMPDTLLETVYNPTTGTLQALRGFLSAAVTIVIFLPLSIHVFDRRDVK